jgi:hypothetical protein
VAARLPDRHRRASEERGHLVATELFPQHRRAVLIHCMHPNNALSRIQSDYRNFHRGRLSWPVEHRNTRFGIWMPFQEGATIPLAWADSGHTA